MAPITLASVARKALETRFARGIRSGVMKFEAVRESRFVFTQSSRGAVRELSIPDFSSKFGPAGPIDTFYIFGSGASVEDLRQEDFDQIRSQRSVGINYWTVHKFVPDFFSFESAPQVGDGQDFSRFLQHLHRREILSRRPEIVILRPRSESELATLDKAPDGLRPFVWFYGRITPATRELRNLESDLAFFFSKVAPRFSSLVLDSGASIVRMISLGILLGFKRIVLLGVDLSDSRYFWENESKYTEGFPWPLPVSNQRFKEHETTRLENRPFAVVDMVRTLDRYFQLELGGKIFIGSESSLLSNFLPVFNWNR